MGWVWGPTPFMIVPSHPRQMQGAPHLVLVQRAQDQVTSPCAAPLGDVLSPMETSGGEIWGTKKRALEEAHSMLCSVHAEQPRWG